jgi:hypothetical protein
LTIELADNTTINQIVIQEEITKGERVRDFILEGKTKNGWKEIFHGSCLGHKFIHLFEDLKVSEVRLSIIASKGKPSFKSFEAHYVNNLSFIKKAKCFLL